MALYEITSDSLCKIERTTFGNAGVYERGDLQRLLKNQIDVVLADTMIIAEEFGEWEESRRRIDLLGLDRDANLVVIELKRTEDGGHMELQSIRYAAMVSEMTFDSAVEVFRKYMAANKMSGDPREIILDFLGWPDADETKFARDSRIVLLSSDFSKELTTAVMWLTVKKGIDIRCVRLVPYADNGRTLIDVQQIIPLPEAADYQIKLRNKEQKESQERLTNTQLVRFWQSFLENTDGRQPINVRMSPTDNSSFGAPTGTRGITFYYVANKEDQRVEIYIDRWDAEVNQSIFSQFESHKEEIEASFGGPLSWEGLFGKRACRIAYRIPYVGNRTVEADWPKIHEAMIEGMIRFEAAISPVVPEIQL